MTDSLQALRCRTILLAVGLAFGCAGPPSAPSPAQEPEPAPVTVSLEFSPLTVKVDEFGYITYRLSAPLDRAVSITDEVIPPPAFSNSYETTIDFPAGETVLNYSSGYPAATIGTWTVRILEDRLPGGVVLGEPAEVSWAVVP